MRTILLGILLLCGPMAFARNGNERPIVGAIRWDAWTGGSVTEQVERTLGPAKYHSRLPWFAKIVDDKTVKIHGGRQTVMDREINFAADAGLDYWAFLVYPESSTMSTALKQYLASKERKKLGFCLILHNTLMASDAEWPRERDRAVALLQEPGYQKVLGNRPLVYTFQGGDFLFGRFTEFLCQAKQAGMNPYCVYMGWNPSSDFKRVSPHGFDAVSNYARACDQPRFSDLAKEVETEYWNNAAEAGVPYIPLITTGWNKHPRKDNPVSWEIGHPYHSQKVFPSSATPDEIAKHLHNGLSFVKEHPDICKAQAVVIYAWNEYDEGGWLAPTRGPHGKPVTDRLDAVGEVLKGKKGTQHELVRIRQKN
ncbi:MAG: hypothetical protein JXM70_27660 [Pirellulales bacterium]|nr:hypothetical protein [Pirellulales bacterium]